MGSNNALPNKMNISLDLRLLVVVLLAVIVAMLLIWKPWDGGSQANARSIKVSGEATLKAEPDEFVFYPSYEFKNADRDAALAAMTKRSDEIVAKLKTLGVSDKKIKTNADGYDRYSAPKDLTTETTYNLQLTVTVGSREEAQKIQDYLVTTAPSGAVTPQASFSDEKRKNLENEARDKATKDARSKADRTARNLGGKLGKVKSVTDGSGFGGVIPFYDSKASGTQAVAEQPQLDIQPGENELNYSVTVEYFLK